VSSFKYQVKGWIRKNVKGVPQSSNEALIVQTLRTNELKVWTVLSTEENVLLRLRPPSLPEMFSFVPSAITQPFFELQTPDFAWKFVWTVPTNYEKKFVIMYIRNYYVIMQ